MKVVCPNCHSVYTVKDESVPEYGAVARCPKCEFMIPLRKESGAEPPEPERDYGKTMILFMPLPAQQEEELRRVVAGLGGEEERMPEAGSVSLKVLEGDEPGREYRLLRTRTVIGRSRADITLDDPEVSRRHAEVTLYGGKVVIKDLGSTNGTFVNRLGVRISFLKDGDELQLGNTTFRVLAR